VQKFLALSDGSIPFVFSKKLFLHIQQPLPKTAYLTIKDRMKLHRISAIFYNSSFTKECNDPLFPNVPATVIYPPVAIHNTHEKKEKSIVHAGRFRVKNLAIDDYKKQGFMVDAFKELVDQGVTGWTFHLASSVKEEDQNTFEQIRKNAKGYPIEFHINKPNKELFDLYNKAKMYWHASGYGEDIKKHPEFSEHFGMTTVEAMGAGAVPVVINSGGQKEIVTDGNNGLLWDTREELLTKTKLLMHDDTLWRKLSENAMIRSRDFSEEKFVEKVTSLIK
jgi:glycosyltransferase involved in cell wall biosynthesis